MKRALILLPLWTLVFLPSALAGDWPLFRGPHRDGKTVDDKAPLTWSADRNIRWKVTLPSKGNSSPIVSCGKVFVAVAEDPHGQRRSLYCFDRNDGKTLWVKTVEWQKHEASHAANPYCASTPAADGQRVVVFHGSAGVYCYDYDGKLLWSRDLGEFRHVWGYASSPVFVGDAVIVNFSPGKRSFVAALDKSTGKILWEAPEPNGADDHSPETNMWIGSWSTPVIAKIDGKEQILLTQPRHVNAYDPADGHIIWTITGPTDLAYTDLMLGNGPSAGLAVAMSGFHGTAIGFKPGGAGDITAERRLWLSTEKPPQRISTGVIFGPHLFLANEPGFACYEAATGKELWKSHLKSQIIWAAMTATPTRIYAPSQTGPVYVLASDPGECKVLAINDVGEGSNSSIAISDHDIFLRTFTHLYCIGEQK